MNLLEKHAKSFYLGWFFSYLRKYFTKCSFFMNFCRTLDDIVDDASDLKIKKEKFFIFKKIL